MPGKNLLGIPETRLDAEPEVLDDLSNLPDDQAAVSAIVQKHPASSLAWAALADAAYREGNEIGAYAYARVGYHRGLDALRRAGWKGQGPVPWSHEPNRGVLRSFYALRRSAEQIGETSEVERMSDLLRDADDTAIDAIEADLAERAERDDTATEQ